MASSLDKGFDVNNVDCNPLQGYLLKRKSEHKIYSWLSPWNKRYFRVEPIKGTNKTTLQLCYYKDPDDQEPCG